MTSLENRVFLLKLIFESPGHYQILYVSEEESSRFREALFQFDTGAAECQFHYLSTLDGKDVLVSMGKLKICNSLWEPLGHFENNTEPDETDFTVLVGVSGAPSPFSSDCESGSELFHLFSMAELEANDRQLFQRYTDADGEEVFINMGQVTFLQVPSWLVEEGRKIDEERTMLKPSIGKGALKRAAHLCVRPCG